jgi:hypothetical protein
LLRYVPAYTVTVDEAGNVIYREQFVCVTSEQRTTIDRGKVAALVAEFQRIGFSNLPSTYTARNVTDLPTTYVSINLDGVSKRITDYLGAPAALSQLETQIDEATNTQQGCISIRPPSRRYRHRASR